MRLHHDKHHAAYVKGANDALTSLGQIRQGTLDISAASELTEKLAFNLSGHLLHSVFWAVMGPDAGSRPPATLAKSLARDFGDLAKFQAHFSAVATQVQGNGWAILAFEPVSQRLIVLQARNHQLNAVWNSIPLLVLDVWEHAYYQTHRHSPRESPDQRFHRPSIVNEGRPHHASPLRLVQTLNELVLKSPDGLAKI